MESCIIRELPTTKRFSSYPPRFEKEQFDTYLKISQDKETQRKYNLWKNGINYRTNRKISINSALHNALKQQFTIFFNGRWILFEEFNDIEIDKYLLDTYYINKQVDTLNESIKTDNELINNVKKQILNLQNWNDFIEFQGKKYGIPVVYNDIHRENDCFGTIQSRYEPCRCHTCEDWGGCRDGGTTYYECSKCGYSHNFNRDNSGPWWI